MSFLASQKWRFLIAVLSVLALFWHLNLHPAEAANEADAAPLTVEDSTNLLPMAGAPAAPVPTSTTTPLPPTSTPAPTAQPTATALPTFAVSEHFQLFMEQVVDGQGEFLRGVHVEDVLALPVVQQPGEDALYVDGQPGTATQFQLPAREGVTGILAHNYLSGSLFFNLAIGQEVHLVFGDGIVRRYRIGDIQRYQKLSPASTSSRYIDLSTGEEISTAELYRRVYTGPDHVTFQTCIKKGAEWSWGLIFVLATPVG